MMQMMSVLRSTSAANRSWLARSASCADASASMVARRSVMSWTWEMKYRGAPSVARTMDTSSWAGTSWPRAWKYRFSIEYAVIVPAIIASSCARSASRSSGWVMSWNVSSTSSAGE